MRRRLAWVKRAEPPPLRVAIAGFGAIGKSIATHLLAGIPGLSLSALGVRNHPAARALLPHNVAVIGLADPADGADIIVECATAALLPTIAEPALRAGRTVVVLSCGVLLERPDLVDLARDHGGRILVPIGALLGLDAVAAAADGKIHSVRMTTRKPPGSLAGAPHLVRHGIGVDGLTEPLLVFEGTAREAARGFPANVNVAAALSLASIGAERTTIAIWADPAVTRNIHCIDVDVDSASFTLQIENLPSENPRTGRIRRQQGHVLDGGALQSAADRRQRVLGRGIRPGLQVPVRHLHRERDAHDPLVEIVRAQAPDAASIAVRARNDLFPLAIAQEMEKAAKSRGITVTSFHKYAIGTINHPSALSARRGFA